MTTPATREFECCPASVWVRSADLGHAEGIDFTLGQCDACGRYWMHLWTPFARNASYVALDEAAARRLASTPAGPGLKRQLKDLFDL